MLYTETLDEDLTEVQALYTDDEDLSDISAHDGLTIGQEEDLQWML